MIQRTAVKVTRGYPKSEIQDDWPVTATPISGGACCLCYMPRDMALLIDDGPAYCWAEWNGVSYDFIDFMSSNDVDAALALEAEVPF